VVDFIVERYGDFVLYRPQFKSTTYLLWLGPFLLLVGVLVLLIRRLRAPSSRPRVDEQALARARQILENKEPNQ